MATKKYRPGRRLVVFFAGVAVLFGLVALAGTWKPILGLDLQGGTRITLIATGSPNAESLEQARQIIDQRVNGSGIADADVTTQGNRFIIVEIPGTTRRDLIEVVKRTAQLRFRLVAQSGGNPVIADGSPAAPAPTPSPSSSPTAEPSGTPTPSPTDTATPNPRPAPALADPTATPTASPTASPTATPTENAAASSVEEVLAWAANPDAESLAAFAAYTCPQPGDDSTPVVDDPRKPLITCDDDGLKFLLSEAVIEGIELEGASAGIPQQQAKWAVSLDLKSGATSAFADISRALFANQGQFAIVLDGKVISNAGFEGVITDGNAQITGGFNEKSATDLATSLKFGALPIAFEDDTTTESIGPSLAGDQLSAGLWAGAFGLGLVMIYCLFYYRGLGAVVLASLLVAAGITYGMVLLLSETAGFTLTLPGIAGLIIGVGVTADSFVIFFERIRDEMREGRSMRVAVETGWTRARKTRMAANVVSLLSAGVLYFFATGVVKGFGFALGLSTLIDLAVLFWFTKHAVSWLAQFKFFNGGGAMSGLSRSTLGLDAELQGGKL